MNYLHHLKYIFPEQTLEEWPKIGDCPKLRTITEICLSANKSRNSVWELYKLKAEVLENKKKYSLVELEFMIEYLDEKLNDKRHPYNLNIFV